MPAPKQVIDLVKRFKVNLDGHLSPDYVEAQVRQDFIDHFFEALGWDVSNREGQPQQYRDVLSTKPQRFGEKSKAPDMTFRIGGVRKFFVECKKPSLDLKEDPELALQLRGYAWSAKLPVSILTDFHEFAIYDCRMKPHAEDRATVARIKYFTYEDYEEKWDEIESLFSHDAIQGGSLETFVKKLKKKKGTLEVDDAFLEEIENWRNVLAHNIAGRNPRLGQPEINYAVQQTIDRIIFMRICEDREIEPEYSLKALCNGANIYSRLFQMFDYADKRYNSGLFYFTKEKGRGEEPDTLSARLRIDDQVLKEIINSLYWPNPYKFDLMPADILGHIYERFLGKVIRLTAGHQAKVEEKPEVRKAGGVYYTPTYIVDYIVKNTVGKLLEGKTPKQVEKLKILDPACGSGSFLIGAYQYLLDWHLHYYIGHGPIKLKKQVFQAEKGEWRLTPLERKRVLLNNIFGVDIDSQAVEVTKLSLLLKVLEGENAQTLHHQYKLFHERALPDLGSNIKWGNSLIGPDYDTSGQADLFSDEEREMINAFDWKAEFNSIMQGGGFDAVIGNPPYLFITEVPQRQRSYYERTYHGVNYRFDLYGAFIERAVKTVLASNGKLGFIIPHTLLSNDSFQELRSLLATETTIDHVVDLGPGVFADAKNETMLLFTSAIAPNKAHTVNLWVSSPSIFPSPKLQSAPLQKEWAKKDGAPWLSHAVAENISVIRTIKRCQHLLGHYCAINQGLRTGDNDKYISLAPRGSKWKRAAGGKHIGRYEPIHKEIFVYYDMKRLDAPRRPDIFNSKEKIVVQEIRNISLPRRIVATYDTQQTYCLQSTNVINRRPGCSTDLRVILGILNSKAVNMFFRCSFPGNNHIPSNQLAAIPIPMISRVSHDRMVFLVNKILSFQASMAVAKTPHKRTTLQRQIAATDCQIDQLVYELYGLTEEEICIVEESVKQ